MTRADVYIIISGYIRVCEGRPMVGSHVVTGVVDKIYDVFEALLVSKDKEYAETYTKMAYDLESANLKIASLKAEIELRDGEIDAQERIVKTQYDGMKKDINDIERLQKIYGIKSTAESAQLYSKFDSIRENMGEITHKLGLSYKKLRESYVQ